MTLDSLQLSERVTMWNEIAILEQRKGDLDQPSIENKLYCLPVQVELLIGTRTSQKTDKETSNKAKRTTSEQKDALVLEFAKLSS